MPSTRSRVLTGVAALSVLAYAVLVAAQLLLGFVAAGLTYLLGWVLARRGTHPFVAETGRRRLALAGGLAVVTFAYGVVVAGRILGTLALAELLVLVAWTTGPDGPLVRGVRWALDARADLRAVRESLDARDGDDADAGPAADD